MTARRIRALLAATAVAAVLLYALSGHGPAHVSHEGMSSAAAALCLLVATAVACAATPKPRPQEPLVVADVRTTYGHAPPHGPPLDARARASPIALQRFRN